MLNYPMLLFPPLRKVIQDQVPALLLITAKEFAIQSVPVKENQVNRLIYYESTGIYQRH